MEKSLVSWININIFYVDSESEMGDIPSNCWWNVYIIGTIRTVLSSLVSFAFAFSFCEKISGTQIGLLKWLILW